MMLLSVEDHAELCVPVDIRTDVETNDHHRSRENESLDPQSRVVTTVVRIRGRRHSVDSCQLIPTDLQSYCMRCACCSTRCITVLVDRMVVRVLPPDHSLVKKKVGSSRCSAVEEGRLLISYDIETADIKITDYTDGLHCWQTVLYNCARFCGLTPSRMMSEGGPFNGRSVTSTSPK